MIYFFKFFQHIVMEFQRNDHNWIFGPTGETDPIIINSGRWSHQRKYREFSTIDVFLISFLAPRPSLDGRLTAYISVLHLPHVVYHSVTPHCSNHRSKPSANPTTSGWYATAIAPWRPSIKGEYRSSFSTNSEPDLHSSFKPPSPSFSSVYSFGTHANHLHHLRHSASRRLSIISSVTQRRSLEEGHKKDPTQCHQTWLVFWRCWLHVLDSSRSVRLLYVPVLDGFSFSCVHSSPAPARATLISSSSLLSPLEVFSL
jgi:hypothetical protein